MLLETTKGCMIYIYIYDPESWWPSICKCLAINWLMIPSLYPVEKTHTHTHIMVKIVPLKRFLEPPKSGSERICHEHSTLSDDSRCQAADRVFAVALWIFGAAQKTFVKLSAMNKGYSCLLRNESIHNAWLPCLEMFLGMIVVFFFEEGFGILKCLQSLIRVQFWW